ncbi:hypothetical protein ACFL17_06600 [Pseudomonadota bacterium]
MDFKSGRLTKKTAFLFALILSLYACGESDPKTDKGTASIAVDNSTALQQSDQELQNLNSSATVTDSSPADQSQKIESIDRKDVTSEEVGVAIYPQAIRLDEHTWKTGDIDTHNIQTMTKLVLFTKDTFAKVADYYRTTLQPNNADIFNVDRGTHGKIMSLTTSNPDQSSTNVLLTEIKDQSKNGTQIKITRMAILDDVAQSKSKKRTETH